MSEEQECIGCREIKSFQIYEELPVCSMCREWEDKRLEEINRPDYYRESSAYPKKEHIPESTRWTVWERDDFTCQICGTRKKLSVDHIYPESKGGTLDLSNLQTLCKRCNSRKGAR